LYWPLLEPAGAVELLAHRVLWSAVVMVALVVAVRRSAELRSAVTDRHKLTMLGLAGVVIAVNWGLYIYGVNNDHVIETSLGYFINPLVTVLMGVFVLGETLHRVQWLAVGLAATAVGLLTIDYGRPPWIALALAMSFGTYGLIKKTTKVGAVAGLTVETLVLAPLALTYLAVLSAHGDGHFTGNGIGHVLLIASSGVVTAVPLLCFGGAATRVPLTTLGLLQYLTPTLQFLIGLIVYSEPMPHTRWIGYGLIWCALALFTTESLRRNRITRLELESSAV
jgi:chloramphenicol-sensitive protein RarD